MPKEDLVRLTCDTCGFSQEYNPVPKSAEEEAIVVAIVQKWTGFIHAFQDPTKSTSYRWYDCADCAIAGIKKADKEMKEFLENQKHNAAAIQKADAELKNSVYFTGKQAN